MHPIEKAILIVGTQADLARALGVDPQLVHQWKTGKRPVALKHVSKINELTRGAVGLKSLRPDLAEFVRG